MAIANEEANRESLNRDVLDGLIEGDLVEFPRGLYSHWGVYIGNDKIVHICRDDDDDADGNVFFRKWHTFYGVDYNNACVKEENFWDVVKDSLARKNNSKDEECDPLPSDEIKDRALSKIGRISYSVLWSNCEHFAAWCRYDKHSSKQVDHLVVATAVSTATVPVVGGITYAVYKGRKDDTVTQLNFPSMKTCYGVDQGLLTGIERQSHEPFTGGIDRSMKTCNGMDQGLLTGIESMKTCNGMDQGLLTGIESRKTCYGVDLRLLTGTGKLFNAAFTGGIDMRSLPGGEMMERTLSGLGHKSCSTGLGEIAALCRNGIPFQVNTALTVVGVVVAVVVVGWVVYELYVHREEVARGIKNGCSVVANGIRSLFGKLFSC